MKENGNDHEAEPPDPVEPADDDTAELPVLVVEGAEEGTGASARGQAAVLEDRLNAALKERDELAAANQRLSEQVQDLALYIEGRRDKWAALDHELESRKARIGELEAAAAAAQARLEEQAAEIGRLRAAATDGREAWSEQMESQSAEERKRIGELLLEGAELGMERDRLSDDLAAAKDEIQALDQKLSDARAGVEELEAENARQQSRIAELEANVAQKSDIIRTFDRNAKRLFALKRNLHVLPGDHADAIDAANDTAAGDEPREVRRMIIPLDIDSSPQPEYALSKPVVTIGRGKTSDIRILDAVVSRVHAQLTTDKDMTIIEDMGSKNGVLVNSHPVDRAVLHHGDVISVGANHEFRYVEIGQATH